MIEEIMPDLFRIEIPLPDSPLKYLNSYVVKSDDRSMIVDTGLNRDECLNAMHRGLEELGIDLAKTDFFITHLHADHFGLVAKLVTKTSKVYFNRQDAELIETWEGFGPMIQYAGTHGFPEEELWNALNQHPGHKFASDWIPDLNIMSDNEVIRVGDFSFQCIETPGHTLGHMCMYEPDKKIFISGDHILGDITPNIQCWSDHENPLKHYLKSLDKVAGLDVDLVLPGHRSMIKDMKGRITELKHHHAIRIDEVSRILNDGAMSAFQVASKMKWDIDADSWDDFPVAQRWFATGEAISHLRYLEEDGTLTRETQDKIVLFSQHG
ncbi:MAG: MBL fold metallo-hydrolase [Deltaproteobacteria bacterium]|nr:MBL fold metallo-hydrolase [Deltaproteobacteria bacterium]MBW2217984.1 MBL fold metallo-hydrolase [Deltaproteobacteria bacterium]